jgi:hypothetical protein
VQKVKIALRKKGVSFTAEIPHELGSGRAGGASVAATFAEFDAVAVHMGDMAGSYTPASGGGSIATTGWSRW